jgi:STE24 endopeptidase
VAVLATSAVLLFPTDVPGNLELPAVDVDEVFGAEHVERARSFERFHYVNWILAQITLLVVLAIYARRGMAFMRESSAGPIGTGMLLGMLGIAIAWLVRIPFRLAAHWWNRRHDQTDLDYLGWLVEDWVILAAGFVSLCIALLVVMGLARWLGERWWLPGAAVFVAIAAVFSFAVPYLDFGLTKPLRDEPLLAASERYERELGLPDIPLRVEEVSADTEQANAYAYGIGPSRRVVFWDTLLQEPFTSGEQKVILAHELAHHSSDHLPEGLAWFAIFAIPGAWLLMRTTRGRGGMGQPEAVPLALVVVAAIQLVATPAQSYLSRRMESEADWVALGLTRDPDSLERVMVNLSTTSLGDPSPPGWVEVLVGTHPTLADRVAMARAWAEREAP